MLAIIQLVNSASVSLKDQHLRINSIGRGLVVFLGVGKEDTDNDAVKLVDKILKLRIFPDELQKMNLSVLDTGSDIMVISQFTLLGDLKGNNRPNFSGAADKEKAIELYEQTVAMFEKTGLKTVKGFFGEHMLIDQKQDGPVTIVLDTEKL